MYRIIDFIKEQIDKLKKKFKKKSLAVDTQTPKIVIRSRHNPLSFSQSQPQTAAVPNSDEAESPPRIMIHSVNQRTPIASGTNVYRNDVDVQNPNLGRGITVNRQRKPSRCPMCATSRGQITENAGGNPRWKCTDPPGCGGTFN